MKHDDKITLGKTGLQTSLLGIGTGTEDGKVQRDIGKAAFIAMMRHAFERGIRLIDTAPIYHTFWWIKDAIKESGIPREEFFIQCKLSGAVIHQDLNKVMDHFFETLGIYYLDSVLFHCMTEDRWPDIFRNQLNSIQIFKKRGMVKALGFSAHNLTAMRCGISQSWVDILLARCNSYGLSMDGETGMSSPEIDPEGPMSVIRKVRLTAQCGTIAMKVMANGALPNSEARRKSIQFVLDSTLFDAIVIGFKNTAEIDEAIDNFK